MTFAAISTGPETHLDHLAPLCVLLQIPLIVPDEEQLYICQTFYPDVQAREIPFAEMTLDFLSQFDAIFHCGKFWALELEPLMKMRGGNCPRFVHCPHGNSDKESFLKQVVSQDISLIYGEQMRALATGHMIEIGNLRYSFYLERQRHFDALAEEKVFAQFDTHKKTLLYAPTWDTKASPTSFFESTNALIRLLKGKYNLLIKLHPLLPETNPAHYWRIVGRYESEPSICFLTQFPAIYPLLERCDAYIGDYSSIGYDFLLFDRPMYFFQTGQKAALQECGKIVTPNTLEFDLLDEQKELSEIKKRLYAHVFNLNLKPSQIAVEIKKALSKR